MQNRSFINKSHFKLYDSIVPVFRLLCVIILIGFYVLDSGIENHLQGFGFLILYFVYALFLIFSTKVRIFIVYKYPFLIGICETLLATYGIICTGGADSPFYYAYILLIAFFGMVHNLKFTLIISSFCELSFIGMLFFLGEELSGDSITKIIFMFIFAVFTGLISERINQYNIKMALYDQLTSLYNRQYFYGELDHMLSNSRKHKHSFSVVLIDVNDFKKINDKFGHLKGDQILAEVGALIKENIRKRDVAARYGGDEFVILLPDSNRDKTVDFCKQLQNDIRDKLTDGITVSIGVSVYPYDGESTEELFHAADMAMYQVKAQKELW